MYFLKCGCSGRANPGDMILFRFTYENFGSGDATDVTIVDTIPDYLTVQSSDPAPDNISGRTYTWYIGNLSAGEKGYIYLYVTIDPYTPDGTLIKNTATLNYSDANGNPYDPKTDYTYILVITPVMTISKVANAGEADPGDTIVYTIIYYNTGGGIATNVTVVDTIPADTTYVSSSPGYNGSLGDTYTWNLGTVGAHSSATITITVTVDSGTPDGTTLHNEATLDYDDANGYPYPQKTDYVNVTVIAPILNITKIADVPSADPDDEIIYTIEFVNSGSGNATNIWINDTIPADTTYVNATPSYNYTSGDDFSWFFELVEAGENITISVVVRVDAGTPDKTVLHNSVVLEYSDDNGNPLDPELASADVTVTAPILTVTKTADVTEADPDDTIVYTIEYENIGTGWASLIEIVDTIPADTTFVNSTPIPNSSNNDEYTWTIGDLAPSGSGIITIIVTVDVGIPDEAPLHNEVTLDYADINSNYYDQLDDFADVVVTAPILLVTKTANVTEADPDDTIEYTIEYENTGTGWASLVEVVDTIPPDTTFVSSVPIHNSSGINYTWTIGDLEPNGTGTITIIVRVNVGTPDERLLHNEVTLDYADSNGNYYDQISDYADVDVTAPILTITKTASVSNADPADTIVYTIEYENTGSGWASLVKIVDTIPPDTQFISSIPAPNSSHLDDFNWTIGDLAPSDGGIITITVKVDVGTPDEKILHNVGTLDYADYNGNFYTQLNDYADVVVTAPILSVTKTADVSEADPDDLIVYTIDYENTGTGWASLVEVVDIISPDTSFEGSVPAPSSSSGDEYTWMIWDLAPNGTGTITITVRVDIGTPDNTLLLNNVTLDYADYNGNYYPQLKDYADVWVTAPILHITKTANVTDADPEDTIEYTINYNNSGTGWASLVKIVDTIPPDTSFVSAIPAPNSSSLDEYTWNIWDLGPNGTGTITIIVRVDVGTPDETILHNEVTLDYADINGNYYLQLEDYANVSVTAPILTINKTASVDFADPDDTIIYTITYHNLGTGWASLVEIVDTIPADTTFVSSIPATISSGPDEYTWEIVDLAPNGSGIITITVTVDIGTTDETTLHNDVTLDYADANGNYYDKLEDYADVVVTAPILTIIKTVDVTEADPGDTINYTLEYENSGTGWASLVEIIDILPPETTFVGSIPSPSSFSGDNYTWDIGDLKPGGNGTIIITVTVDIGTTDESILKNEVTLDYADYNGNYYDQLSDYANVIVTAPVMYLTKTANVPTADPGDTIIYTIEYENAGTGLATGVFVNDTIPDHVTFVSSVPGYIMNISNFYLFFIGNVAPDTIATVTITVTVDVGTDDETLLRNEATLDYADSNGNYYPRLDDFADVIVTAPILTMSKSVDVSFADPDDLITYTISYYNSGTGVASGVIVEDTIPDYLTFEGSPTPDYNSSSGKTYTWNLGDVGPNSTGEIVIVVRVDIGTPDETPLHNTATLDYADANGNYYTQLQDSADSTVTAPILSITKTANVLDADPGDLIEYTITYENLGTGWASLVKINDTIPPETSFMSSIPSLSTSIGDYHYWNIGDLAPSPNGTGIIKIKVRVDVGTPDKTLLVNGVILDWADANENYYTPLSDDAEVEVTAPIMTIVKTVNQVTTDPGDIIIFTIDCENTGSGWASGVIVEDTIPAYTTYVSSNPGYLSNVGDLYEFDLGDVAPGITETIILRVKVDERTPDETILNNTATLDYADANGNYYDQLGDYADLIVTAPILSITKTVDVADADPGDPIVYTIDYENTGTGWASLVEIVDSIPSDTTLSTSVPGYNSSSGDDFTWAIGDLKPGGSGSITITVTVDVGTADKTLLNNTVTLDYADANGNYYDQLSDYAESVVTAPVMSLNKTVDVPEADPGDPIVYTIIYENTGTGDATNITIIDMLPLDVTFDSALPVEDSVVGQMVTWKIPEVKSGTGGSITVNVVVNVGTPDQTPLLNEVTLDYSDANDNHIEQLYDYAESVVTAPVMIMSKDAGLGLVQAAYVPVNLTLRIAGEKWHDVNLTVYENGEMVAYAYIYRIPGNPDEQAVTIEGVKIDILSNTHTAVVKYTPWDDPINGQVWGATPCWLILRTEDGHQSRIHHTFNVRQNDTWTWLVGDMRPHVFGLPFTFEVYVPYTINYENIGTGNASNVIIKDTLPTNTSFEITDSVPAYDSIVGHNITWNIGDVPAGGIGTVEYDVVFTYSNMIVDPDVQYVGVLTNNVTLDYSDANGNFIEQLGDSIDVKVPAPDFSFAKKGHYSTFTTEDYIIYSQETSLEYTFNEDEEVHFTAYASYLWDEPALSYGWDFGDGVTTSGMEVSHTYNMPGQYDIILTVMDGAGNEVVINSIATVLEQTTTDIPEEEDEPQDEPTTEEEEPEGEESDDDTEVDPEPPVDENPEDEDSPEEEIVDIDNPVDDVPENEVPVDDAEEVELPVESEDTESDTSKDDEAVIEDIVVEEETIEDEVTAEEGIEEVSSHEVEPDVRPSEVHEEIQEDETEPEDTKKIIIGQPPMTVDLNQETRNSAPQEAPIKQAKGEELSPFAMFMVFVVALIALTAGMFVYIILEIKKRE
jgi:uncharacterized repeat protein (TIGR01451 family)